MAVDTFLTSLNSQIANHFSESQGAGVTEDSCDSCHNKTAHKVTPVTRGNLTLQFTSMARCLRLGWQCLRGCAS